MASGVPAKDVIKNAKEHALCKQLYYIQTTPKNGIEPIMENLKEHLEFQGKLEKDGIMVGAGPIFTDDGETWEGEGMVIVRADSIEDAKKIADSDPMHKSGARSYRVRPWLMNEGSLTVTVKFSSQSMELD